MQPGGPPSNSQQSQDSPLDQRQSPTARENTPEQPGGDQEQRGQEEPQDPRGETPRNPYASTDEGENRPAGSPPDSETGRAGSGADAERWGHLPPRVRDVLRTESTGDMPVRYREWIDQYYRRLNSGGR